MLEETTGILRGLTVDPDAMHRNLHLLGDIMLSEAAMMHLAAQIGRSTAHEVVYQAAMRAWETGRPLRDSLADGGDVALPAAQLDELAGLLVPERYLGSCQELVDQALVQVRTRLGETAGLSIVCWSRHDEH